MNLQKLFELQRRLDDHIEKEHPQEPGEDRLAKKILALQVELGELANELPEVFKFWSNKKNNREKALEEFCDALHFILSIGLEIEASFRPYPKCKAGDVLNQFRILYRSINEFDVRSKRIEHRDGYYKEMFQDFLNLGEMLGFTWEQIEEAYMKKNAENHARQANGY